MPSLPALVLKTCRRERLFPQGARVLVAVSGGPDSVAMLHALHELGPSLGIELGVAHFNHHIRGDASDADAGFVAGLSARFGVRFHLGEGDVPALAVERGLSPEAAARTARYSFLRETACAHGYQRIAVGHTLDDQAETVLLAVLRGAGLSGLGGMAPLAGDLARPLIEVTRGEVLDYLGSRQLAFRTDESNLDIQYTRNRIRHVLLPMIERDFNPGIKGALVRMADSLRSDERLMQQVTADFLDDAAAREAGRVRLNLPSLKAAHVAVRRRAVREAARMASGEDVSPLSFANAEDVLALFDSKTGASVDLPAGLIARLDYGALEIGRRPVARPSREVSPRGPGEAVELQVPGTADADTGMWQLRLSLVDGEDLPEAERKWRWEPAAEGCVFRAVLDYDQLRPPLVARTRRRGDRFWPHGAPGERKLQDFLTDARVPRAQRCCLPLLVDGSGRVAAVFPLRPAHWALIGDQTRRVLVVDGQIGEARFLARYQGSC